MMSPDMKQLISENAEVSKIRDLAYREGGRYAFPAP